jgi:hypothetical protein
VFPFLLQWPTRPTPVMFPRLGLVNPRMANREDRDGTTVSEEEWETFATTAHPRSIPRLCIARAEFLRTDPGPLTEATAARRT